MPNWPPPVDERLLSLDTAGTPRLYAGRDRESGRLVYPPPADDEHYALEPLPREGTLWSWTVQRFRPKTPPYAGPEAFEPYAVGYVALGDALIVEGRLTGCALDGYRIDMPMMLTTERFERADGAICTTFAFAPRERAA